MKRSTRIGGLVLLTLAALAAPAAQGQDAAYHVVGRIPLSGEGGWDYLIVDTAAHRLYVSRSTHVAVIDLDRDSVVGDIPNTLGVHGIAFVRELGRGFTSNGRDSTVTIFDLRRLAPLSQIKVTGRNPDAITYDPVSKRVFTFNGGSANATALDARTGAVVGTIDLGGKPEFAVSDARGRMYVNIEDKSEVVAFDPRSLTVVQRWSLAPCEEPTGLAIDRRSRRLFSVCSNALMAVLDADRGRVVTTLPIGSGVDGAAFDPATGLAFSSNGEGTLTVVHEESADSFRVVGTVATQRGGRTVALDERTHRIYTVAADYGPAPEPTPGEPPKAAPERISPETPAEPKSTPASRLKKANTTRQGVKRQNAAEWRKLRDLWDETGYEDILSDANRKLIAQGKTPIVDEQWIKHFPGDEVLKGEKIPMHHIQGGKISVPLPESRHLDAHKPGGYRHNPGGPGTSG